MTTLKPGDEVRVLGPARRYRDMPEGGYPGTVVKAGRRYATAEAERLGSVTFDMETGLERGGGFDLRVKTPERVAADYRADQACKVLYQAGFEIRVGRHPSGELLEALAAVAENFKERTEGET
jgi:hypothetical protein